MRRQGGVLGSTVYDHVQRCVEYSRRSGTDLATNLYANGLLWTPRREARVRAEAMRFLLTEMEQWRPAEFLRKVNKNLEGATPQDMYMGIHQWIEEHIDHVQMPT